MGVRYIVRLAGDQYRSPLLSTAMVVLAGPWKIYRLPLPEQTREEHLRFLPTLVIGKVSYKQRRTGQIEMNRLLEEQFRKADFDISLVHASESDAVLPTTTEQFGGLIFTDYPERQAAQTVALIQHLPESKPVFLFPKPSPGYTQLADLAKSRPNIHILYNSGIEEGNGMGDGNHSTSNFHEIEDLWAQMAAILRSQRTSVAPACLSAGSVQCPVLIHYS